MPETNENVVTFKQVCYIMIAVGNVLCIGYLVFFAMGYSSTMKQFDSVSEIGQAYRAQEYLGMSMETFLWASIVTCISILFVMWKSKSWLVKVVLTCASLILWGVVLGNDFGEVIP